MATSQGLAATGGRTLLPFELAPLPVQRSQLRPTQADFDRVLALNPDRRTTCVAISNQPDTDVLIVDDFYADPRAVRDLACAMPYEVDRPHAKLAFPGFRSDRAFMPLTRPLMGELERLMGPIEGSAISNFQYYPDSHAGLTRIHADHAHFAGLVYLNDDRDGIPGTALYRHKQTGLVRSGDTPAAAAAAQALGLSSDALSTVLVNDCLDAKLWEPVHTVSMRFNRAVFYRGHVFHCSCSQWGTTAEDSRMVQVFFVFGRARSLGA